MFNFWLEGTLNIFIIQIIMVVMIAMIVVIKEKIEKKKHREKQKIEIKKHQELKEMAKKAEYHGCPFLGFILDNFVGWSAFISHGDPIQYRKCALDPNERGRCIFPSGEACLRKCDFWKQTLEFRPKIVELFDYLPIFPNGLHPSEQKNWEGITVNTWLEVCE